MIDKKNLNLAVNYYYKLAQGFANPEYAENLTNSRINSIKSVNPNDLTSSQVKDYVNSYLDQASKDFQGKLITQDQYKQIVDAGAAKIKDAETPERLPAPALPTPKPKAQNKQNSPKQWGGPLFMQIISKIQEFLIDKLGPDSIGATKVDGKWGPKSQAALKQWLSSNGKSGSGLLDEPTLIILSDLIPEVKQYYIQTFGKHPTLGF
jgi:hypothetical protein